MNKVDDKYVNLIARLDNIEFATLRGFKCGRLLAERVGSLVLEQDISVGALLKGLILGCFFTRQGFRFLDHGGKILFYGHYERADNFQRMHLIASCAKDSDWCEPITKRRRLAPRRIMYLFIGLRWFIKMKKLGIPVKQRLALVVQMISGKAFLDAYIRSVPHHDYTLVVTLADFQLYANILAQYYHLKSVPTATLQDGNPIRIPEKITAVQQFMPAFRAFVSDYYLAWGEYYKELAVSCGLSPDKIVCLGMPKYIGLDTMPKLQKKSKVFAIMLDHDFLGNNKQLIQDGNFLAKELGMKYILRFHPATKTERYSGLVDSMLCIGICEKHVPVSKYLEGMAFVIGCNSAVVIEAMLSCAVVIRRIPEDKDYLSNTAFPLEYASAEDALELVKNTFDKYDGISSRLSDYRIRMCGSGSIENNYREFFSKFPQEIK